MYIYMFIYAYIYIVYTFQKKMPGCPSKMESLGQVLGARSTPCGAPPVEKPWCFDDSSVLLDGWFIYIFIKHTHYIIY